MTPQSERHSHLLKILIIVLAATLPIAAYSTDRVDKKTARYLDEFRESYSKSWLSGNPDLITRYYADDVRLMPEFQQTVMGRENATLYHRAFSERFGVTKVERNRMEVLDLGAQLMEMGVFKLVLEVKVSGQLFEVEGTYMNLWRDSDRGEPVLVTDAWNYNKWYDGLDAQMRFAIVPAVRMAFQPRLLIDSNISLEIAAIGHLLETVLTQHDADVWSRLYTDDAILAPNHHPVYKGKEAIDGYMEKHVKELPVFEKLDIRSDRIDHLGKYTVVYSSHVANWRVNESSGVGTGKNIKIWRRGDDHSLKVFRTIAMYD